MSNVIKGLKAIKAAQAEKAAAAEAANRPKANWFKLASGQSVKVAFLQELDEESPNYNPDRGTGIIAVEHNAPGPDGWKRRGLCSMDAEGHCYPDERHKQDPKAGWRQKQNLYINVLVDYSDGNGPVSAILSRNANSSFVMQLIDEAAEDGTITDNNFKITRQGEGTSTTWMLKRLKEPAFDSSKAEVFNLEDQLREITYENQPAFYGELAVEATSVPAASKVATADDEW